MDLSEVSIGHARICPTRSTSAALDLTPPSPGAALTRGPNATGFIVDPGEVEDLSLVLPGALA